MTITDVPLSPPILLNEEKRALRIWPEECAVRGARCAAPPGVRIITLFC